MNEPIGGTPYAHLFLLEQHNPEVQYGLEIYRVGVTSKLYFVMTAAVCPRDKVDPVNVVFVVTACFSRAKDAGNKEHTKEIIWD